MSLGLRIGSNRSSSNDIEGESGRAEWGLQLSRHAQCDDDIGSIEAGVGKDRRQQ